MASCWIGLPQVRLIPRSERVALRPVLPGGVVTWFVTGFPDLRKADGPNAIPLYPALPERQAYMAGRVGEG
jgi:hypothetical protein